VLRFEIEAVAFCHQMVRSVVGTLVEVGRGRKQAGDLAWILRSCDRALAGSPAPPHGLCLWAVTYPGDGGDVLNGRRASRVGSASQVDGEPLLS
jgi:tRNA pseudouridine38-40 synthase